MAVESAYKRLMERLPENAEIIKRNVKFIEGKDNSIIADVMLNIVEDIGTVDGLGKVIGQFY